MIKAIVADVEGTVSKASFVSEVLLPYARDHLRHYLLSHMDEPEVASQLETICHEQGQSLSVEACCDMLESWIDEDRKVTALKTLQGLVWEAAYQQGKLSGELYEDAVRNLQHWKAKGIRLFTYSSGSVRAQQLLFRHNPFGDLTSLFSGYFDTRVGHKQESSSYEVIASEINERAGDILFLSDSLDELNAARAAGMQTRWLVRVTTPLDTMAAHPQVKDFDAISLD